MALPDLLLVTATRLEMSACLGVVEEGPQARPFDHPSRGLDVSEELGLPYLVSGSGRIHLLVCGTGPLNASASLGRCLGRADRAELAIGGVVNLGVAGTYAPELFPVGSRIAACREVFPEYGLRDGSEVTAEGFAFPQVRYGQQEVYQEIPLQVQLNLGSMGLSCHTPLSEGVLVTVAGCSATPEQAERMRIRTGGLAENMEGFALALACRPTFLMDGSSRKDGLPFLEIRTISNIAGYRPPRSWSMDKALAELGHISRELFPLP